MISDGTPYRGDGIYCNLAPPRHRYRLMPRLVAAFSLIVVASLSPATTHAQDRAKVVPGMPVLLDNECVRVQYHDVGVGETIPMHSHPSYIVYTLAPFRARIRLADGTVRVSDRKGGEAYWNAPITHSVENLGTAPVHNLIIEMKPGTACRRPDGTTGPPVKPRQ
ncbi:MAG: hypothetical protein NVS1B4_22510 [Gemmatimonadaceae bacterium]